MHFCLEKFLFQYLFELETLRRQDWQFQGEDPGEVVGIDKVPCVIVDDGRKLATMIEELSRERVIGVDTEHHWYRSYLGITSLIQVRTTQDKQMDMTRHCKSKLRLTFRSRPNPKTTSSILTRSGLISPHLTRYLPILESSRSSTGRTAM